MDFVLGWSGKTEIAISGFLCWIELGSSKFYDWRRRYIFSAIICKRRARHRPDEKRTEPFDPAELERPVPCPNCRQRMETHPYFGGGNVVVDTCERCSLIWLDAGKLALIERYVPYVHQIEPTLTLRGGRYQGGPSDVPSLGTFLDCYWQPKK